MQTRDQSGAANGKAVAFRKGVRLCVCDVKGGFVPCQDKANGLGLLSQAPQAVSPGHRYAASDVDVWRFMAATQAR
jgi:hypothetical protein